MVDISFVIPCYRSEKTIGNVVSEIDATMLERSDLTYEIILVNDCSPDGVWGVLSDLAKNNERITAINLAKNFGQHCALMAGYSQTQGEIVVSLDDDGQTPASDVFKLIDALDDNTDVVYASYIENHQNLFRRLGSDFAQSVNKVMLGIKEDLPKGSSFFVMKRYVVDEILKYKHAYPFIFGLVLRATRKVVMVKVEHRDRLSGRSGYSLRKLISLWLNGFTSFSVLPLEFGTYIGFIFATVGFIVAIVTIINKLVNPSVQAGWSSIFSAILIVGGIIMIMLGLIGEYIGRIYICINNAPQYVIRDIVSKGKTDDCN
ncbi:MAG: glycosyltransferase family 2 protein [Clostridiales bacterium]|nr:glycosyltransferase family 2 protein [Clostridiales bacterium]